MGTEKGRLRIINKLKQTFLDANKQGVGIDKEKLVLELCLNYGVTRKKGLEYIQILIDSKFIVEELKDLWLTDGIRTQVLSPEEEEALQNKDLEAKE